MGREIKRVPIEFNWPKDAVWGGYLNPYYKQCIDCPECNGRGSSKEYKALEDLWYGYLEFNPENNGSESFPVDHPYIVALAKRNTEACGLASPMQEQRRLQSLFNARWMHHLNQHEVDLLLKEGRLWDFKDKKPTAREVNEWSIMGFGHDAINCWIVVKDKAQQLGIRTDCCRCNGEAALWPSPEIKKMADEWSRTEPPDGEGYQLWETVSEGSPISPVFVTPEELADWLVSSPDYKWKKNDAGTSREQWLKFIRGPGWCPSLIGDSDGIKTGVQAL